MATKTKTAKGTDKVSLKDIPHPPSVLGLMNRLQVCRAMGGISVRKLSMMISAGEFHRSDFMIGGSPRWTVQKFNEWVEDNRVKHDGEGV